MGKSLGITKSKDRFIKIESSWFESPAYRDLRPVAKCLLTEFLNIYRPGRNGKLVLSIRQAARRVGVVENTVIKAFHELVEHGFLILTSPHRWMQGMAREFELTIRGMDVRVPRDSWKQWQPGKPVATLYRKKNTTSKTEADCLNNCSTTASVSEALLKTRIIANQ